MVKLPLGMEYALLGLMRGAPAHAYAIHKRLAQTDVLRMVWHVKQRQTYAALDRLVDEGYIREHREVAGRRPPRRMFQLTAAGEAAYARWVTTPVQHGREFRQEFMARLYCAGREGPATLAVLIAAQEAACAERIAWLASQAEDAATAPLDRLVVRFRLGQLLATRTWLAECRAELLG
jgi:DNA-binding PadR family transcriptional regulator